MTSTCLPTDRDSLVRAIATSLDAADALGLTEVGIALNDALIQLTGGRGVAPPR